MKILILISSVLLAFPSFAQMKPQDKSHEETVGMHESMAKAHQQAADCLKSGKNEQDCKKEFQQMCKDSGGPEKCEHWMKHQKMEKKSKQ